MKKIKVIDSIMGSGKTSWAIQHMNEAKKDKKFIYITPFLTEVERVKKAVTSRSFSEPTSTGKGKLDNLKKLILNDCNIVSTHALFKKADEEIIELLKAGNYILILDEVMDVVAQYTELEDDDFQLLLSSGMIQVEEDTGILRWNKDSKYQKTKYDEIKRLCKTESLVYFEKTILFWTFPVSVFQSFKEVYVMTYLFEAQEQKYYYDMYQLEYEYKAVQKVNETYELVNHVDKIPYDKELIKSLINIYEGNLNNIGYDESLSFSWYLANRKGLLVEKMKKNIYTYFFNNVKTSSKVNMWTSFKDDKSRLKGKGYAKGFVSHNARATNEYKERESLAYTINRFMNPYKLKFFLSRGVDVNQDMYALSELIQWVWRSRIREGKAINLYIPSKRMRKLLEDYLNSDL
jgi:hypothetical protein